METFRPGVFEVMQWLRPRVVDLQALFALRIDSIVCCNVPSLVHFEIMSAQLLEGRKILLTQVATKGPRPLRSSGLVSGNTARQVCSVAAMMARLKESAKKAPAMQGHLCCKTADLRVAAH